MTVDVVTVSPSCSIEDAAALLARNRVGVLPVVDAKGRLIGVVSKTDLVWLRALEGARDGAAGAECTVEALYTPAPITVEAAEPLDGVARRMRDHHIHHVIVVDAQRRPVGVIGTLDVLARAA